MAHKTFDGSIALVESFLTAMLGLIARNMGEGNDSQGTLFQSQGITLNTCKTELA